MAAAQAPIYRSCPLWYTRVMSEPKQPKKGVSFKTVLTIVIVLLLIVIVLQNTATVETTILFFKISMPRALLLFITGLVGFVAGLLYGGRRKKKS